LIFDQPSFDEELEFRTKLTDTNYDLSPVIIVDEILHVKLTIELNAKTYEDTREKLIII